MAYERIMGIDVIDEQGYQQYRDAMTPILTTFGGSFGFDFKVSEVLKSKTDDNINRVFTITFDNKETMDAFFSSPDYITVKEQYFKKSVKSVTKIALAETSE